MKVAIREVFTWPKKSSVLRVDEGQAELGVGASFNAALLDIDGKVTVNCGRVHLTQQQYDSWIDDDDVAAAVATNLGFTVIQP